MRHTAYKLLVQGRKDLVERMVKVHAFDARFPLRKDNRKWLYLLDPPIYDYGFELQFNDGAKKLLADEEAVSVLNEEFEYTEKALQETQEHLKDLDKFFKFGPVKKRIGPRVKQEPDNTEKEAPPVEEADGDTPVEASTVGDVRSFDVAPGVATICAAHMTATRIEGGFSVKVEADGDHLFTGEFTRDGRLRRLSPVKCTSNAMYFERHYQNLFRD